MRQKSAMIADFRIASDKYPATCFLRVLPSISSGLTSTIRTHWHSAMRTQFNATGDFVIRNVGQSFRIFLGHLEMPLVKLCPKYL